MRYWACLFTSILLASCGGGGSGNDSPNSPTLPPAPAPSVGDVTPLKDTDTYTLYGSTRAQVGESISFAIVTKNTPITQIAWHQLSGPDLTFLSETSQLIAFDAIEEGNYDIFLSATLSNGTVIEESLEFSAVRNSQALANLRLDHEATELATASLRVDHTEEKDIDNIIWKQLAGPKISTFSQDGAYAFFTLPSVSRDAIIEYEATVQFTDGTEAKDRAYVLVKDTTFSANRYFNRAVATTFPYRKDSPYQSVLQPCIYNNTLETSCAFSTLPLIGMSANAVPTNEDILNRLLVSHSWMGDAFKTFLENSASSQDIKTLLGATTAIVISYDINPSFYTAQTGAIYLSANHFWQTPAQRDSVNDTPDYRSNFGEELGFVMPWRYVKDGKNYIDRDGYPASARLTRTFSDMEANVVWLLYHELAHANDYFPPSVWASINKSTTPLAYWRDNPPLSEQFSQQYPLNSEQMKSLAQVRFQGEQATARQQAYTGDDVTLFFKDDRALEFYSYSTEREDFALLVEQFMMAHRMQALADVAIIDKNQPADEDAISWGERNRVNHPDIQARAKAAIERILPNLDATTIQSNLPESIILKRGESWSGLVAPSESPSRHIEGSEKGWLRRHEWRHGSFH
ncbi:hypothetical protein OE749_04975 [Aestuariibacter sp. AA17]|uniref:Lipoprotein n=1 Tax=Fluctibacter corallii TaxID=2984329 RepID=A0ABT3A6R2_9ALTE|nr:hypothetical protein [Aestuariibacter sp. AA17]MCV2884041.1 hypothetical protein [Aestuariibacter sp. AA17]